MKSSSISIGYLQAPLAVVLVAVGLTTGGSLDEAGRYLVFHALFVVLPAFALGRAAFPEASTAGQVALGGPAAYGALVLFATAGIVVHLPALAFASPLLAIVWLTLRGRRAALPEPPTPPVLGWASTALLFLSSGVLFFLFAWPSRAPTETLPAIHFHDNMWTLGNTRSLLNWGLPLRDIRVDGFSLGYHLGQNVVQSVAVRFFGLDPFGVMFRLEPFGTLQLLVLALVFGPFVVLRSRLWVGPLLGGLLLLTDGRGLGLYQTSYWNPVSFAVSVAPFVVFQLVVMGHLERRLARLPVLITSLCFLMMGATKGILLGFVPAALALTLVVRFVRERRWPWQAVSAAETKLGIGMLLSLVFLAKTLFAAVGSTGLAAKLATDGKQGLAALAVVGAEGLRTVGEVVTAGTPVPLLVCVMMFSPSLARGFWRGEATVYAGLLAASMVAFWAILKLGGAIFYFRWYPALALSLLLPLALEQVWGRHGEARPQRDPAASPRPWRGRALLGSSLLVVACGLVAFARHSLPLLSGPAAPPLVGRVPWSAAASIDRGEWDAMRWLERHSAPHERFFSDRHTLQIAAPPHSVLPAFFAYSALSGRQAIADGGSFSVPSAKPVAAARWQAVQAFVADPTGKESVAWLHGLGARWFVQSLRFDRQDFGGVPGLALRFQNSSVRIYEVTNSDSALR
jgi:hypothetical protein